MCTHLKNYLQQFRNRRCATLVGPMTVQPSMLRAADEPLIWVDGGVAHRAHAPTLRGFAVGDGDSAHGELNQLLPTDKDYSDLAFALRCLAHCENLDEIVLCGFVGGRIDHQWFNVGEVHHFLAARTAPCKARFDDTIIGCSRGEWRLHVDGVFSLAAIGAATVTLQGACKYPIAPAQRIAPLSSFGLSNVGVGEVTLQTDAPVFLIRVK